MLTYSLVDRGTVAITGLDQQTKDKAKFEGQYYSDKLPGFSLLATVPYAIARSVLRLPSHPLNQAAFPVTGPPTTGPPWAPPVSSRPGRLSSWCCGAASWAALREGRA